ncbi:MAG: kinase [Sphingobacteriia bacterium]|nr:kinase [Sphingobacteriia bacterium]
MIISRTPYRISFFGGGTDYEGWFKDNGGQVLSTTINHYCYLTYRLLPPFFDYHSRVLWSKIEEVQHNNEIIHPVVNAVLKLLNIETGVEVHHQGDLPGRSGLGTSSTFTVGMLNAAYNLSDHTPSKKQLAKEAIYVERNFLKEDGGIQDQIAAAYGGFNHIKIDTKGDFEVIPVAASEKRFADLQSHLMLFFTGLVRNSFEIAKEKSASVKDKYHELTAMSEMVDEAVNILNSSSDLKDFGKLLHESWLMKKKLSNKVSTDFIDSIYEKAIENGAIGGKVLGAGGGGFILFFVPPENHQRILDALKDLLYIPFNFEDTGASIIFEYNNMYTRTSLTKRNYIHLKEFQQNNAINELIVNAG